MYELYLSSTRLLMCTSYASLKCILGCLMFIGLCITAVRYFSRSFPGNLYPTLVPPQQVIKVLPSDNYLV